MYRRSNTYQIGGPKRRMLRALVLLSILSHPLPAIGCVQSVSEPDTLLHVRSIEVIAFRSNQFEIVGNLYVPKVDRKAYPLVIWVSGSGPSLKRVQNTETINVINCFLDKGVAYFRIDKPGSGDSKGALNNDSIFAQLSDIVVDAIGTLRNEPLIQSKQIGLFGSSQAGYIMPLVIAKCSDVSFMIGSSCPGENSIEQWNYLIENQMVCDGTSPERARKNIEMFSLLRCTTDKKSFDAAITWFDRNPMIVRSVGYDSSFSQQARSWWPRVVDLKDEMHFDPMTLVEHLRIPLFLAFGGHDKQIDPVQAIEAYRKTCAKAGNKHLSIVMLPNSDHNMKLSGGCLNEIQSLSKGPDYRNDPQYLSTLRNWIEDLALSPGSH